MFKNLDHLLNNYSPVSKEDKKAIAATINMDVAVTVDEYGRVFDEAGTYIADVYSRSSNMKLVEIDHGERTVLKKGTLQQILGYLQKNDQVYNWILDEDPEAIMPDLDSIECLADLQHELDKVDLGWWSLKVEL